MNKKLSKEAKNQGKGLKAIWKKHIDKYKEKGILCEAGAFYAVQGIFKVFHACNGRTYESAFFIKR